MTSDCPLVLVVEDDDAIRRITCAALTASQYRVIQAVTGKQALEEVAARQPDVILTDLGLPDMSGIDLIRQLCNSRSATVVVFSAGGLQHAKIEALEAGAVDFIDKPFTVGDLLSCLRSAVKRHRSDEIAPLSHFKFGDLDVDLSIHRVTVRNQEISLTSRELLLLTAFLRNAGRLLTHDFLNHEIWKPGESPDFSALPIIVSQLRQKLEPDPARPRYFLTEIGVGYRFRDD